MIIRLHQFLNKLKQTSAWKNKIIVVGSIISLVINLGIWSVIYFKFYPAVYNLPADQSFIPLHYNIYLGIDLFGSWQKIFILPVLGLIFFLINTITALMIYNKKEIISYFLTISCLFCQIFLAISTIIIILINI